jgi:hypothetical protein
VLWLLVSTSANNFSQAVFQDLRASYIYRHKPYGIHEMHSRRSIRLIACKESSTTSIWTPTLVGDCRPVYMMSWRISLLYLMEMSKVRLHVHNSPPSSFTTSLVVVSKMSHTPSSHNATSSHLIGFIVCDICNNHVMNKCIYTKIILARNT